VAKIMATVAQQKASRENGKRGGTPAHLDSLMLNKVFGDWTVMSEAPTDRFGIRSWNCVCKCGKNSVVGGSILRKGRSTGCKVCANIRTKPYEVLYKRLVKVSERRKIKVMSYEDFLSFTEIEECVYCGETVSWIKYSSRKPALYRYNLDKKENSLDYSKENCVVCCKGCNYIKSNKFTYEQMLEIGALIKKWRLNEEKSTASKST
jgi:hypothetical protein